MKHHQLLIAVVLLALAALADAAATYNCRVTRLDSNHIAVVCDDGADPTGYKQGNAVVMSCVSERK